MQAAQYVRQHLPQDFTPHIALILGSGLGDLANQLQVVAKLPYTDIPGFFQSTVAGHAGNMIIGYLSGKPVICLQGRVHLYEGAELAHIRTFILTLHYLCG